MQSKTCKITIAVCIAAALVLGAMIGISLPRIDTPKHWYIRVMEQETSLQVYRVLVGEHSTYIYTGTRFVGVTKDQGGIDTLIRKDLE